jgi:RNA polymerase sigma factor (sigma-70 family)
LSATLEPTKSLPGQQQISRQDILHREIETHYSSLQVGIRVMAAKSGLVEGEARIIEIADEILQSTIETAFKSAAKLDPTRSAYSWLMGIAVNKLREMRRSFHNEMKRVQLFSDDDSKEGRQSAPHGPTDGHDYTAEEIIDSVLYSSTNRALLEDQAQSLNELLSLVKDSDRQILSLAIIDRLSGADLAAVLGIREGAAYVRLARAKDHLRKEYLATR